jgi:predicted nucleic acid-binding Zn ribbon protein
MTRQTQNPENTCENCGKPLFGRTDKRFCNDNCRNTYNRQKTLLEQKKAHDNLPEISRPLKGIMRSCSRLARRNGVMAPMAL